MGSCLVRLRHKLLEASNDAGFERRGDGRFCWNSEHNQGLSLVCDAVVLAHNARNPTYCSAQLLPNHSGPYPGHKSPKRVAVLCEEILAVIGKHVALDPD